MKLKIIKRLLVILFVFSTFTVSAKIPEPSNIFYGNINIGTTQLSSQNKDVLITLEIEGKILASYRMGDNPDMADQYLLIVPMDIEGERIANSARKGDVATILVAGVEAASITIGERGQVALKNLKIDSADSDKDGMPDDWELLHGLDPFNSSDASIDSDGDGLTNLQEFLHGTNPRLADTDGDGMNDMFEVTYGLNPLDASDAGKDNDNDGYTNLEEAQNGTDPTQANAPQPFTIELAKTLIGHTGDVSALVVKDNKLVSTSHHNNKINVWDLTQGQLLYTATSNTRNGINAVAVDSDRIVVGTGSAKVELFSLSNGQFIQSLSNPRGSVLTVAIHDNNVIAGSADGKIAIWDINTGEFKSSWLAHDSFISGLDVINDRLYSIGTFPNKSLKIWNWNNHDQLLTITGAATCCNLTNLFLSSGKLFISGLDGPNTIKVISLSDIITNQTLTGHLDEVMSLSAANHRFFSGSADGNVNIWSLATGNLLKTLQAHTDPIGSLTATKLNLVTGDTKGAIKIWKISGDESGDNENPEPQDPKQIESMVITEGDIWSYFKGNTEPPDNWTDLDFNDSGWLVGATGIGYGDNDDATVLNDMRGHYNTIYGRKSFHVSNASKVKMLKLIIDFDDGFIAYLNGKEVARYNMPMWNPKHYTNAIASREAGIAMVFDLSEHINKLNTGTNLLSIETHNVWLYSEDLSMIPELYMVRDHD